jgi:hypothetical protein
LVSRSIDPNHPAHLALTCRIDATDDGLTFETVGEAAEAA